MSDPRAFMKLPRVTPSYRPVEERVRDQRELIPAQDVALVRAQATRCMDCGVPFCQGESGCPLGNLIPEWNELASQGHWQEALDRLHATNNFPEFTGRLCPAPCESACVLGLHSDPVTIKAVEREIIDEGFALGLITPRQALHKSGLRVAIIGSGPAGLAAAQELARKGHDVTVFEKASRVGGLLRYGIPDFKMAKELIDRRVEQMQAEGVRFETSVAVGTDISFERLRSDFDAIGLAMGAERPRDLIAPGRDLGGIHFAMDYLIEQNQLNSRDLASLSIDARDKSVVIIGGGDTGSDCLGTAHRQGARKVFQFELLPRPPASRSEMTPWPLWPMQLRSSHAHEEGGVREWSLSTKAFRGDKGLVTHLIAERVEWSGGKMIAVPGSEIEFEADLVLLAMGFVGPSEDALMKSLGVHRDARANVSTNPQMMTSIEGVFAAGDIRRGASLIVWAIAEGRHMAASIDRWLSASAHKNFENQLVLQTMEER